MPGLHWVPDAPGRAAVHLPRGRSLLCDLFRRTLCTQVQQLQAPHHRWVRGSKDWVGCRRVGGWGSWVRPRDKTHPPDGSTNPQPPSRTRRRQVCVLRRPPLASQLLLLRPLLHLPGGSGLRARRRPSAMPGLQPGRALSQGSRTKAPSPDRLWDPASPQFGAPLGLQDSASPLQRPQSGTS